MEVSLTVTNNCEHCDIDFEPKIKKQRFCSKGCNDLSYRERTKAPRVDKNCEFCGIEFTLATRARRDQRFCSSRCKSAAWAANNADRRSGQRKLFRANNLEQMRARDKVWRDANPDKRRGYMLKKCYGMTSEEWDDLLRVQEGRCAICFITNPTHTDHDHITGKIRGILCFSCNTMLGNAKDNTTTLEQAIAYLQLHEGV